MPSDEAFIRPARISRSEVVRTYRRIAPVHDWFAKCFEARARQRALKMADVQDGEHILEVGVGTGLLFEQILRQNPNGWTEGIDITPAMLRRARHRAEHAPTNRYRLRLGDAYALDYPDAAFDGVLASYLFDLLPTDDFMPLLRSFKRVLRSGGQLVVASMTRGRRWYQQGWEWIYRLYPPLFGGCRGVRMAPFYREAGFEQVERELVSEWTFPSEVVYGVKPASEL